MRHAHISVIQAQVQSARAPGFVTKTQEADSSEMLAAHKAALRARAAAHGASRPVLLSKMEGSLSGASMQDSAAMGKTLSLVRPRPEIRQDFRPALETLDSGGSFQTPCPTPWTWILDPVKALERQHS